MTVVPLMPPVSVPDGKLPAPVSVDVIELPPVPVARAVKVSVVPVEVPAETLAFAVVEAL